MILWIDIPDWYSGQVLVGLKDAVFQASFPLRHVTELHSVLRHSIGSSTVLFIYSDGGPDHRLTYVSVQLSVIALFLNLNLDFLVACRTAPNHSWRNPVERIMSLLNIGLQRVGIMWSKVSDDIEETIKNCNNLKQLRKKVGSKQDEVALSLKPCTNLLKNIFKRLELKEKKFWNIWICDWTWQVFWSVLLFIDSTLTSDTTTKKALKCKADMCAFIKHCCQIRHYSFQMMKFGNTSCQICNWPRGI